MPEVPAKPVSEPSESFVVDALGSRVRIALDGLDAGDRAAVRQAWSGAMVADEGDPSAESAFRLSPAEDAPWPVGAALSDLSQVVTFDALAAGRGRLWMLHAAGLSNDEGRAAVLVGPSGRGKTTAARVLGGVFGYLSDESVGVDGARRVLAYRKPLSIIESVDAPKAQRSPGELGLLPAHTDPVLAVIALLERDPSQTGVEIERLAIADALTELVPQTSFLGDLPRPLRTLADHVAAVGGVVRLRYAEATALEPAVQRLLAEAPDLRRAIAPVIERCEDAMTTDAGRNALAAAITQPPSEVWFRGASIDSIEDDESGALLVLSAGSVLDGDGDGDGDGDAGPVLHVLDGIAPVLWWAADGASIDELERAVVEAFGEPPTGDARELVADAVASLAAVGLLASAPTLRVRDDGAWAPEAHETIGATTLAVDGETGVAWSLALSAELIWEELREPTTPDQLVARVAARADLEPGLIDADVRRYIADLVLRRTVVA